MAGNTIDWDNTDTTLSSILGFAETEDWDDETEDYLIGTSAHRYGWYPGVISHGEARGEGVAGDSAWQPVDEIGRILSGSGTMRAIKPDRRRYERSFRYAALRRTERNDVYRGVALLEEYAATRPVRYYPDRDYGTVATPGSQNDPADRRTEIAGYYWTVDVTEDPAVDWNNKHPDICSVTVRVSGRAD
jgi:hypothetical protein